jgi:hypothetical protein
MKITQLDFGDPKGYWHGSHLCWLPFGCTEPLEGCPRRIQLQGRSIPPGAVYIGRNLKLDGGLITDGIHWGNPYRIPSEIHKRAARYRGLEESGRDEYWALMSYFQESVAEFCGLLDCDPDLQKRIKRGLRGKVLVCHWHPDFCCHGNILCKVANAQDPVYCVEFLNFIGHNTLPVFIPRDHPYYKCFYAKRPKPE